MTSKRLEKKPSERCYYVVLVLLIVAKSLDTLMPFSYVARMSLVVILLADWLPEKLTLRKINSKNSSKIPAVEMKRKKNRK